MGLLAVLTLSGGCQVPRRTPNPSFPTTHGEARADLTRMAANPAELARPLVVVAGIGDPAISSGAILKAVRPAVAAASQRLVVEVSFFDEHTFQGARQKLLREVGAALGTSIDDLPEVDVVAFSMGGLVVRSAAIADEAGHRLPIRRLFTISTPHEGARLAGIPIGTPQSDDMRPTSDFIARSSAPAATLSGNKRAASACPAGCARAGSGASMDPIPSSNSLRSTSITGSPLTSQSSWNHLIAAVGRPKPGGLHIKRALQEADALTPSQPGFASARHRALSLLVHKRQNQKHVYRWVRVCSRSSEWWSSS